MKVLDFGSGCVHGALDNWSQEPWIESLKKLVVGKVGGIIEIHCLDTPQIEESPTLESGNVRFLFHPSYETLPMDFDAICAMHPNPETTNDGPVHDDEGLQNKRYILTLADMANERLKMDGKIIVQFDDEFVRRGREDEGTKFISMLNNAYNFESSGKAKLNQINVQSGIEFPSSHYGFSSLHIFQKTAA